MQMTQELLKIMTELLSNETKLSLIELEAMSKAHKLALNGFKRYFRCRSKDRLKHSLCLKEWVIDYAETNIPFETAYSSGNAIMTLDQILSYVYGESEVHLNKLKDASEMAFAEKETTLGNKLNVLVDDQEEEHKYLRRLIEEYTFSRQQGDPSWISRKDMLLHKKYKKIEKK